MRLAALALLLLGMTNSEGVAAQNYSEGQVWQYKTRPGEAGSLLRIGRIETHPKLGQVFHIGVVGVRVRNPLAKTGFTAELPHFPVSKDTLDKSVTKLSQTISVAEIVSVVEEAVQRGSAK